jgi:DNA-directed RNA polymerase subunit RPC12/RpoP
MNPKICIDCKQSFIPKSNRSIRCSNCQLRVRKEQKAKDKKKARSLRTLDGIAIIHKEKGLEPISARGHRHTSDELRIIAEMVGGDELRNLIHSIKKEMKYNKENIGELRTKITLINHWYKIANRYEKDIKWRYERILDEMLSEISDNDLFNFSRHTSDFGDVRKRAEPLNNSTIEIINLGVENIRKLIDEENGKLRNPFLDEELERFYASPIDKLKEYRKWKRMNSI